MNDASPPGHSEREAIIRVRGLKVAFGDHLVMDGLDLDLYRGEVLGFVGASGAGKSVLTRTILGLLHKQAGTIEVFGHDIYKLTPREHLEVGLDPAGDLVQDDVPLRGRGAAPSAPGAVRGVQGQLDVLARRPGDLCEGLARDR